MRQTHMHVHAEMQSAIAPAAPGERQVLVAGMRPPSASRPSAASLAPHCRITTVEHSLHIVDLASISSSDVVYDLGCGTAESLVGIANACGCNCVGVELDDELVAKAKLSVRRAKAGQRVQIVHDDFLQIDLRPATVVYVRAPARTGALNARNAQVSRSMLCSQMFMTEFVRQPGPNPRPHGVAITATCNAR